MKLQLKKIYTSSKWISVRGRVIRGGKMGREIGFPTATINAYTGHLKSGVYGVIGSCKGKEYGGIMNIGVKPTFESPLKKTAVVHLFDFYKEIYGETLECQILFKVREERKFPSTECLKQQIQKDIHYVIEMFNRNERFQEKEYYIL